MEDNSKLKVTSSGSSKRCRVFNSVLKEKKGYASVTEFRQLSKEFDTSNCDFLSTLQQEKCLGSSNEDYSDQEESRIIDNANDPYSDEEKAQALEKSSTSKQKIVVNVKTIVDAKMLEYEEKFKFFLKTLKSEERAKETSNIESEFFTFFPVYLFPRNFFHINQLKKESYIRNGVCFSESKGNVPYLYRVRLSTIEDLEEKQIFTIMILANYSLLCQKKKVTNGYIKCSDHFVKDLLYSKEFNYVQYLVYRFLPLFYLNCFEFC